MKKIANYVGVARYGTGGVIGMGSSQVYIENKKEWDLLVKIISLWLQPKTRELVISEALSIIPDSNKNEILSAVSFLEEGNFLIDEGVFAADDRYSRNTLYYNYNGGNPNEIQHNLKSSSAVILGCGGIGNHISVILATSGVGKLTLVDADTIEISNLTRQVMFSEEDVGLYKVDVLERELKKRNSSLQIEKIKKNIKSKEDLSSIPSSDIFIVSADYPTELIFWVNEFCVENKIAYINSGYINDISLVGPFYIPEKTSCIACKSYIPLVDKKDDLLEHLSNIGNIFKPATFAPINNISASFAAADIIRYLGKFGELLSINKRIGIYSNTLKIETQDIPKNLECVVCCREK